MKLVNSATSMRVPARRCSTMPIELASIAQAAKPSSAMRRNAACSRTGSGVVRPVDLIVQSCVESPVGHGHRQRRHADAQRADEAGAPAQQVQRLRRPPRGRRLAVGAGGGDDLERLAGLVEERRGDLAGGGLHATSASRCARPRSRTASTSFSSTRQVAAPAASALATKRAAVVGVARPGDEARRRAARRGCPCAACR